MTEPRAAFRRELSTLRDNITGAIRSERLSDIEEGLTLYRKMVEGVLDQFQMYAKLAGRPGVGITNYYGTEMQWLDEDLRSFIARATKTESFDVIRPVYGLLYELLSAAYQRDELEQFGRTLRLYQTLMFEVCQSDRRFADGVTESLLLQLNNFTSFSVIYSRRRRSSWKLFAERLAFGFSELAKIAIDLEQPLRLDGIMRHFRHAFESTEHEKADVDYVGVLLGEAVLGLAAYVLLKSARGLITTESQDALLAQLETLRSRPSLDAFVSSLDVGSRFEWTWWEVALSPERSGAVTFEGFLALAYARMLADGAATARLSREVADDAVAWASEQARTALESLRASATPEQLARIDTAVSRLEAVVKSVERTDEQILIDIPLDADRIQSFREAAVGGYRERNEVRRAVRHVEGAEEDRPEMLVGHHMYVPKDYFAETKVHADPADLGRDFGSNIARNELDRIHMALHDLPHAAIGAVSELPGEVKRALERLRSDGLNPQVVVFNGWTAFKTLAGDEAYRGSGEDAKFEDAVVRLEHVGDEVTCVVADLSAAIELRWWRPRPQRPTDLLADRDRLLVGVQAVSAAMAEEVAAANDQLLRKETDTDYPLAERIRRLQQQAIVRVLVQNEITLSDGAAGVAFELSSDAD